MAADVNCKQPLDDLFDIQLTLDKLTKKLTKEDPVFLENINNATEETQWNVDMMMKSTSRVTYLFLQTCRGDNINHAIELPLKALQSNGLLTQHNLNHVLVSVYPIINARRQAYEKKCGAIKLAQLVEEVFVLSRNNNGM